MMGRKILLVAAFSGLLTSKTRGFHLSSCSRSRAVNVPAVLGQRKLCLFAEADGNAEVSSAVSPGDVPDLASIDDAFAAAVEGMTAAAEKNAQQVAPLDIASVDDLPGFGALPGLDTLPMPPPEVTSANLQDAGEVQSIWSLHNQLSPQDGENEIKRSGPFQCHVEGLSYNTTEDQVFMFFHQANPSSIYMPISAQHSRNKGIAYLSFDREEDLACAKALDKKELNGRWLSVREFPIPLDNTRVAKVKGLPFEMTNEQRQELFESCGEIESVIMTDFTRGAGSKRMGKGAVTYVTFKEPKSLIKALAMDGETVQERVMDIVPHVFEVPGDKTKYKGSANPASSTDESTTDAESEDTTALDPTRIYLDNLEYQLTVEEIRKCLEGFPGIGALKDIELPKFKGDSSRNRGYGFIQAESVEQADKLKALSGTRINGRPIEIRQNNKVLDATTGRRKWVQQEREPLGENLVYISGLPFSATEDELRTYLENNGVTGMQKIALPSFRGSGRNRGVGYVAFSSPEEQQKAFEVDGKDFGDRYLKVRPLKKKDVEVSESDGTSGDSSVKSEQ